MWFFGKEPYSHEFAGFTWLHWTVLGVLVLGMCLTVVFKKKLREQPRVRRFLPLWLGCVAWTLEIVYHWWTYINDLDFVFNLVPLELCYVSLLLTVVLVITRSQAVFEIYYFISLGAVAALLFPAFGAYGIDHFRFWHYFICHGFITWLTVWFLAVEQYRLRRSALLRLMAFMLPFVALVRFIDWYFSVNYMYLAGPTGSSSPLDFLGSGPMYLVKFIGLAVAIFTVMYLVAPKEPRAERIATLTDG